MGTLIFSSPAFAAVIGTIVAVIIAGSVSPGSDGRFVVQGLGTAALAIALLVALILTILSGALPALVVLFAKQAVIGFVTLAIVVALTGIVGSNRNKR